MSYLHWSIIDNIQKLNIEKKTFVCDLLSIFLILGDYDLTIFKYSTAKIPSMFWENLQENTF